MSPRRGPKATPEADAFAGRRRRLEEALREDAGGRPAVAVIFSGQEADLARFFPEADFYYLTGVSSAGAALLMLIGPQPSSHILLLPAPDPAAERWTGKVLTSGGLTPEAEPDAERTGAMKTTGFQHVGPFHQLEDYLLRPLRSAQVLYLSIPPDTLKGPIGQSLLFAESVRRRLPTLEIRNASSRIASLRRVKDAGEVAAMRRAAAATERAYGALVAHIRPGMAEYEAQAILEALFLLEGAESTAFTTIVGSGPYSCILHYDKNRRRMKAGDLVVCDSGARLGQYCADVTRTYPVSGKFTRRQRQVYDAVLEAQEAAIGAVKPGARIEDVHAAAKGVIEGRGFGKYFFHGTSHYLGLQAHDPGDVGEPLEPGCVITVEPGIYIASEELGVRIEDDVLVTPGGREVLTSVPKEAAEVERLLKRPRKTIAL